MAQRILLPAGEFLFRQGEAGDCAYIVERGRIEIRGLRSGSEVLLNVLGPGVMLGELAVIDSGTRTASALAVEDTELIVVTREQLSDRIVRADPVLGLVVRQILGHLRREIHDPPPIVPEETLTLDRMRLEGDLSGAVARGEFESWYQPVVDLEARSIAGFEALIRWRHPTRGLVSPATFVPLAEDSGLIVSIGHWMLQEACRALRRVDEVCGHDRTFMCVNVSCRQLEAPGYARQVAQVLTAEGVAPGRVHLEVTEGLLITSPAAREALHACKQVGVRLSLDDFGTGYSSLAYLNELPFDLIKIDRSFAPKLVGDGQGPKLVRAMLGLAELLDRGAITEGIETAEQRDALRALGGRLCQGFYFARPAPLPVALGLLAAPDALAYA